MQLLLCKSRSIFAKKLEKVNQNRQKKVSKRLRGLNKDNINKPMKSVWNKWSSGILNWFEDVIQLIIITITVIMIITIIATTIIHNNIVGAPSVDQ